MRKKAKKTPQMETAYLRRHDRYGWFDEWANYSIVGAGPHAQLHIIRTSLAQTGFYYVLELRNTR